MEKKTVVIKLINVAGRASTIGFRSITPTSIRTILIILGKIIEQVSVECRICECQVCFSSLSNYVHLSIFYFIFIPEAKLCSH